jgi:serine/threonine-protein kinase HipA
MRKIKRMKLDPKLNVLAVQLHGKRIGTITRLPGEQHLFAFEQEYVDDPGRATLSLSFKGQSGGLVTALKPIGRRVPPFFSNLLPEGHLRDYLAQLAGVKAEREFFLLAALGVDLPGALTVTPLTTDGDDDSAEDRREKKRGVPDTAMRFSLAGVQLKFSAISEAAGGLTIPVHGTGGSWIVKLPSSRFDAVPENEFVMLELARAVGISVPEVHLAPIAGIGGLPEDAARMEGNALAVKRFDRTAGGPVHMEDFAQVFALLPDDKYKYRSYANVAAVLWAETGAEGTYEFIRRLVFSVLIGNGDMHLKNWSVIYPDRRTPVLSPAYDFVSTIPYLPGDRLGLSFGGSRSMDEITVDQIRRFTDTAGLPVSPVWNLVRETMERTEAAWRVLAERDLLPGHIRTAVGAHIDGVARAIFSPDGIRKTDRN